MRKLEGSRGHMTLEEIRREACEKMSTLAVADEIFFFFFETKSVQCSLLSCPLCCIVLYSTTEAEGKMY